jgi:hypothetical protein
MDKLYSHTSIYGPFLVPYLFMGPVTNFISIYLPWTTRNIKAQHSHHVWTAVILSSKRGMKEGAQWY